MQHKEDYTVFNGIMNTIQNDTTFLVKCFFFFVSQNKYEISYTFPKERLLILYKYTGNQRHTVTSNKAKRP